jgi:hypothetical protein
MADYYPLIAKAVTGLDKSTGEARRAVYERARTALVGQLRNMTPPLSESEITRERLALEEAIRKVEAEAARRMRNEPKAEPPKTPEPQRHEAPPSSDGAPPPANEAAQAPPPAESPAPPKPRGRFFARSQMGDRSLKGFRDVVAEAESLGDKTAQTSKSARAAYASVPANVPELDRIEPRVEPEGLRSSVREPPARQPEPVPPPPPRPDPRQPPARQSPGAAAAPVAARPKPRQSRKGVVAALLTVIVIIALAVAAVWQRDRLTALFGRLQSLAPQAQRDAPRPKIPDRIGQDGQVAPQPQQPGKEQPSQQTAAVAQRVVLYEEDPSDPAGKRYAGSAIWRTEMVAPAQGQAPELAVRCDVEVPDRRLGMTLSFRRNTDPALPASHTIEIMFNLPADFPFGGINNVPGILMKQAEQTRGAPLAGVSVKATSTFYLLGLSSSETEMKRNIELLKERSWFDIPLVYNNGRRAILAVEKGNPGEKAFNDAFAAWKQ